MADSVLSIGTSGAAPYRRPSAGPRYRLLILVAAYHDETAIGDVLTRTTAGLRRP